MFVVIKVILCIFLLIIIGGLIAGIIDVICNRKLKHKPYGIYEAFFKRVIDFVCGMLVLTILLPLYLLLAIMVRLKLGAPAIFKQERPGKDEKIFRLYKFRTMTDERDTNGELLPDANRLTTFGSWLRRTSLDEIPEAFNIVKGDMSLIGPRPLLVRYLPYYDSNEKHRHDVRPGLTGLAQIHGRNYLNWEERFTEDLKYVNRITFIGDIKIILETVKNVIKRKDIMTTSDELLFESLDIARKSRRSLKNTDDGYYH